MKINWSILDDEMNELKDATIETFDERGNIEGQFEIIFNKMKFGYVDNEIPFGNELLISWFTILNKAINELKKQGYVIFYIPDSPKWLEIQEKENVLFISKLELMERNVDFLITGKNQLNLFRKIKQTDKIKKYEFINCVHSTTTEFINRIWSINKSLRDSDTIRAIIDLDKENMH